MNTELLPGSTATDSEGTKTILGLPCTYEGKAYFVRPISQWFGTMERNGQQFWHLRMKDLISGKEMDFDMRKLDFTNTKAWERAAAKIDKDRKVPLVERVDEVDPRQQQLPNITVNLSDATVGGPQNGPGPDDTKLL